MEPTDSRSAIMEEAAHWWARVGMRDPRTVSRAEREAFTEWLRASPVNVAELLRIANVHFTLEHFRGWKAIPTDEPETGPGNVVSLERAAPRRRRARFWGVAASAFAAGLVCFGIFVTLGGRVIQTARAERREVVLSDGSVVQLEPETRLEISFGTHQRRVWLQRGRALFRVAKDPRRPFWVRADQTLVRAVGTEFGVEDRARSVVVTVAEGKVAVLSSRGAPPIPPARGLDASQPTSGIASVARPGTVGVFVTAGEQVTVPADGTSAAPPVRIVDASRALAWARGRLVFENEPLADVVAEFNEYNQLQLRLGDPALARRRVSGVFDATDPETLLAFIQAGSRVRIRRDGNQEAIIEPAP